MHLQITEFRLKDITAEAYAKLCTELAPAFAAVPGLVAEVWLANAADNRYGAVYTWEDRAACEQFTQSGLFRVVNSHPNMKDITWRDFDVVEGPSRATRGFVDAAVANPSDPEDGTTSDTIREERPPRDTPEPAVI